MKILYIALFSILCISNVLGQNINDKQKVDLDSFFRVIGIEIATKEDANKFPNDYLFQKLSDDNHQYTIEHALFFLRLKNDESTIDTMATFLTHQNRRLVANCINSIKYIKSPKSSAVLGESLNNNKYDIINTFYLVLALRHLTYQEGISYLEKFLNSDAMISFDHKKLKKRIVQTIYIIKQYNKDLEARHELMEELLMDDATKGWAIRKMQNNSDEGDWISLLRKLKTDPYALIARKKLGDTIFINEEIKMLNIIYPNKSKRSH